MPKEFDLPVLGACVIGMLALLGIVVYFVARHGEGRGE